LDCTSRSIFWDGLSRLGRTRGRSRIRKENSFRRGFALPRCRFITRSTRSIRRPEASGGAGRADLIRCSIRGARTFLNRLSLYQNRQKPKIELFRIAHHRVFTVRARLLKCCGPAWLAPKFVDGVYRNCKERSARLNFIWARSNQIRGAFQGITPLAHPSKNQQSIRVIREKVDRIQWGLGRSCRAQVKGL